MNYFLASVGSNAYRMAEIAVVFEPASIRAVQPVGVCNLSPVFKEEKNS